ncbi:MAG: hypothetical protein AB1780_12165 [Pseudomonadota bacterium]
MQELTFEQVEEVNGGVGPWGAVVGGVVAGGQAALSGKSGGQIAGALFLGAASGFFGGAGAAAWGAGAKMTSVLYTSKAVMAGVASGL